MVLVRFERDRKRQDIVKDSIPSTDQLLISTGEVSGDVIGAYLAAELRSVLPELSIFGSGGHRMANAGVELIYHSNHLGSVAFTEPLRTIPGLLRLFRTIRRRVRQHLPRAAVLIGNDLFNTLLARWLKRQGVFTISYFPPQIWVWRAVVRPIARSYDLILASFPEEAAVYAEAGGRVDFVGHYLVDRIDPITPDLRSRARKSLGFHESQTLLALFPGTRRHELEQLAPVLLGAAERLQSADPSMRFVLPIAEPDHREYLAGQIEKHGLTAAVLLTDDNRMAMAASDLLLLASGTATLEAALMGIPMVIVYRVSAWSMLGIRSVIRLGLIKSEIVGLPNLILQPDAVPELRQRKATAKNLAHQARMLLNDPRAQREMKDRLSGIAGILGGKGALALAAARISQAVGSTAALTGPALADDASTVLSADAMPQKNGCCIHSNPGGEP